MSASEPSVPERLVKSDVRVRDLGEVFTPSVIVEEMLDLVPEAMWSVHPSATFLEPACGDGNFLVAILQRKLAAVSAVQAAGSLPAGVDDDALTFHGLQALASIYAVDISVDNIVGGTPGHEIGARERLITLYCDWHSRETGKPLSARSVVLKAARWIVEHNLIVGNMLPADVAGRLTGREKIPLIEYEFDPATGTVTLSKTTMGNVMEAAEAETAVEQSLFGPTPPKPWWSGKVRDLAQAEAIQAPKLRGPARNGAGR